MKITSNEPTKVNDLAVGQTKGKEPEAGKAQARTTPDASGVKVNREGLATNRIKDAIAQEPEVRPTKVAELKAKLQQGEYKVDEQKLAQNMVNRALREDLER